VGWARRPVLDCNLENARFYPAVLRPLQRFRVKKWDYYGVTTPEIFFSATIADLGYAGTVFVYLVDFESKTYHEESKTIPLAGGVKLPRNSTEGESSYLGKKQKLRFWVEENARRVQVAWMGFEGETLEADITFAHPPDHESTVIVIPIGKKRFYYNRKINAMPASGYVKVGFRQFRFEPQTALGNLDWGRGVWEYESFWVWASASGRLADGRTVGLNMGYGFGDDRAATENTLLLDGRIHKLGRVDIRYNPRDFMSPWWMVSEDGRVNLHFHPILERVARTPLVIIDSEVHQMFGRYQGQVVADDGEVIAIDGLIGWAEEHRALW
ncbi:MAG: DUF2804 domain-containing protein, partial [Chloroflexi bacterium]|nr:DUF2804 domain-containing protein [Chloroflexota bacterium]